jgi:hypothetical protein
MNIRNNNTYIALTRCSSRRNAPRESARVGQKQSTLAEGAAKDFGMFSADSQLSPTLAMFRRRKCQLLSPPPPLKRVARVGERVAREGSRRPARPARTSRRGSRYTNRTRRPVPPRGGPPTVPAAAPSWRWPSWLAEASSGLLCGSAAGARLTCSPLTPKVQVMIAPGSQIRLDSRSVGVRFRSQIRLDLRSTGCAIQPNLAAKCRLTGSTHDQAENRRIPIAHETPILMLDSRSACFSAFGKSRDIAVNSAPIGRFSVGEAHAGPGLWRRTPLPIAPGEGAHSLERAAFSRQEKSAARETTPAGINPQKTPSKS